MKRTIAAVAFASMCAIIACTKETGTVNNNVSPATTSQNGNQTGFGGHTAARTSAGNYSQSISVDTANRMIQSYLNSVGYPAVDTSIRSLSFDADTLRAYLSDHSIVTLKFIFAHTPAYANSGYGTGAGLNPGAITLVIAGVNENDQYVLNNRNGVYDHMSPCPTLCLGDGSGLIAQ